MSGEGEVRLTDFLLARCLEEERLASTRVVQAMCQAAGRVADECQSAAEWAASPDCTAPLSYAHTAGTLYGVCKVLALPYADHPDYREEWRP